MLLKPSQVFALAETSRAKMAEATSPPRRTSRREERSFSNEEVTPESAITSSGVIAIITLLSQDTSSLPLLLYARRGRNKFRAADHPYYRLMHDQPNDEMSSMTFRELIASHIVAWGNFYGQMIWNEKGEVTEIWPLRPDRMTVQRVDGKKIYLYRQWNNEPRPFTTDDILHIPGWGFDGLVGYSKISLARNAIGLAISAEKFGSKLFANDARPGVVYMHPGPQALSDTAYGHLQESLKENQGVDNSWKPKILEEGLTIKEIGIPPEDAQFLQTRQFQLAEINRILGPVPPHMIGDIEKSTSWGTGIDSQEQGYVNHTLRPLAVRIEQALNLQLLLKADRDQGYFFEHLFDGLLRGDIAVRYEAYVKAVNNGFMSRNEVRERENLNPRSGLDDILQPLNMTVVGSTVTDPQQSAFMPLIHEAALRVIKRETNDLRGAVKRHLSKGQTAEFSEWSNQFYGIEQPAFIQRQFGPIVEAYCRIFSVDDVSDNLSIYFDGYVEGRKTVLSDKSSAEIETLCDGWVNSAPQLLTKDIMSILNGDEHAE